MIIIIIIIIIIAIMNVKLSLKEAVKSLRVLRRRGSHIVYTVGSQMAVRLSALRAGHPLSPGRLLVLISGRG
jgi:hypothetical protein